MEAVPRQGSVLSWSHQTRQRDGTYDIEYDDGEKEMFVAKELIKLWSLVVVAVEAAVVAVFVVVAARDP